MHGQCDVRPAVTFPTVAHRCPATGSKLHWLNLPLEEAMMMWINGHSLRDGGGHWNMDKWFLAGESILKCYRRIFPQSCIHAIVANVAHNDRTVIQL